MVFKRYIHQLDELKTVFTVTDFRLPLWTGVDMGELLAARLKLPIGVIIKVALIVDFAEYYQKDIVEELLWVANLLNTTQSKYSSYFYYKLFFK